MECVVCGKHFEAKRSDARCCSSNCRHKVLRERKKLNAQVTSKSWQLDDSKRLKRILDISPKLAPVIDDFRFYFSRDVAVIVITVCEKLIEDMESKQATG